MINVPFDEITKETIERLVVDKVEEGRELDYKAGLPGANDREKKEFAADVASFANARGGYIVYGVTERKDADGKNTGLPEAAPGCSFQGQPINFDIQCTRLEQMVLANIEPRIQGVRMKAVLGFPEGAVVVMHIPRSWSGPHLVTVDDSRFHTRATRGKYAMDVTEIRAAFLGSADLANRIRAFRDERLGRIIADESPVPIKDGFRIVVHLVPFASMTPGAAIDLKAWANSSDLEPMEATGWDGRYNLDGYFTFAGPKEGAQRAYTQVFRSGAMEMVASDDEVPGQKRLNPWWIERNVVGAMTRYVRRMRDRGIEPPVSVLVSLLHTMGAVFDRTQRLHTFTPDLPIARDTIVLPDVVIETRDVNIPGLLKPAFDALWQALGVPQSLNYSPEGTYEPGR